MLSNSATKITRILRCVHIPPPQPLCPGLGEHNADLASHFARQTFAMKVAEGDQPLKTDPFYNPEAPYTGVPQCMKVCVCVRVRVCCVCVYACTCERVCVLPGAHLCQRQAQACLNLAGTPNSLSVACNKLSYDPCLPSPSPQAPAEQR